MNKQKFLYKTILWICMLILSLSGCSALPVESDRVEISSLSTSHIQESSESQPDAERKQASSVQGEELDAAYTVYELAFEWDGMQIYGNFYLPKSEDEQYPTAIIGHGFGSSYSYMAPYAAILAENGIASYVFDFCGGSPDSRSDGNSLFCHASFPLREAGVCRNGPFAEAAL